MNFNLLDIFLDNYERKARLEPALVLIFPPLFAAAIFFQEFFQEEFLDMWQFFLLVIVMFVAVLGMVSNMIRSAGLKKQEELKEIQRGIIFTHANDKLDSVTKERYHKKLAEMCGTDAFLTVDEETKDKEKAKNTYKSWIKYIKSKTRDRGIFWLIHQEYIHYSYRRNLLGIRTLGIIFSSICLGLNIFWAINPCCIIPYDAHAGQIILSVIIAFLFLLFWWFRVSKQWVLDVTVLQDKAFAEAVDTIYDKECGGKEQRGKKMRGKKWGRRVFY